LFPCSGKKNKRGDKINFEERSEPTINTYTALKEVLPWSKPACEDKARTKILVKLTESYLENHNPVIKKFIDHRIKELEGGQD